MEYTPEVLKKVQDKSIELMLDMDSFFEKNDIDYMISAGTALGAVRHGGFIPWDDDVDFDMHIDDMKKLKKAYKKDAEFQKKYFLQNKHTDPNNPVQFWRIRMNGTTMMDKEALYIPLHWGIPVDIFPVFNAPNSKLLRKVMLKIFNVSWRHCSYSFQKPNASAIKKSAASFAFEVEFSILTVISNISKHTKFYYYPTGHGSPENRFIKREVFFPTKRIEFEGHSFKCHHDIKEYLRITYGDYMTLPPEEQRVSHQCYKVDMENDYKKYVDY